MQIVSGCLVGIQCRYDGKSEADQEMLRMLQAGKLIPLCPEQLGGLPTPRPPSEIDGNDRVINDKGEDVTEKYRFGANQALKIAKYIDCRKAYLKSKSPMCGCGEIYDGTFSNRLTKGDGVFTRLLKEENIEVLSIAGPETAP